MIAADEEKFQGLKFEKEVVAELRQRGCVLELDEIWDRKEAVDFIVHTIDGARLPIPVFVQLTLQVRNIEKLQLFVDKKRKEEFTSSIYITVEDEVEPAVAAALIRRAILRFIDKNGLPLAPSYRGNIIGLRLQSDKSWSWFNPYLRLKHLRSDADPKRTAELRQIGRVIAVNSSAVIILMDDKQRFKAYFSDIVDYKLREVIQKFNERKKSDHLFVNFIPTEQRLLKNGESKNSRNHYKRAVSLVTATSTTLIH